ncbi:MAG: hypothetical protein NZM25_10940 [Leptospiraceae bacterium]|nr:hypothetical protein [Leptospiraceae bacterium]MDW8305945.1 hypothetical protein [Leptospiraceae bacterium]
MTYERTQIEKAPEIMYLEDFEGARLSLNPQRRLEEVRKRARKFREKMLSMAPVSYFKSIPLVRVPYPTRYGFFAVFNEVTLVSPILHITNRLFVIQYKTQLGMKTLLFSPSDIMANAETRFFKRFAGGILLGLEGEEYRLLKDLAQQVIAPFYTTVEDALRRLGISPEEVDYITYDHLHTQDLRRWLGDGRQKPYFPNAKLIVMKEEWESAKGLLPPQRDWYCPGGIDGVPEEKVILLDGDVLLGEGVALVKTPGHTFGNHSLVVRLSKGLLVSSENGISPESYAPHNSANEAIRKYALKTGVEVILNGNTQESGLEQYISMVMEKEIAGPSWYHSDFPSILNSSQFSSYWMFPGLSPTFEFPDIEEGQYRAASK